MQGRFAAIPKEPKTFLRACDRQWPLSTFFSTLVLAANASLI
jgi:hypothetical protein